MNIHIAQLQAFRPCRLLPNSMNVVALRPNVFLYLPYMYVLEYVYIDTFMHIKVFTAYLEFRYSLHAIIDIGDTFVTMHI